MKTTDVAAQKAFKNLFAPGKDGENVVAGKRRVMEESDLEVGPLGTNEPWGQPEVVVMHPNNGSVRCFTAGSISEALIDLFENAPISVIDVEMCRERMKDWPERFL